MKRRSPTLLGLLLLAAPAALQAQFTYTVNPGGSSVTIIGYTGNGGAVTIPSSTNGLAVTIIGDGQNSVFFETGVTGVTIPSSVTSIGGYAFDLCTTLSSVTIGNGVTNIGESAFQSCSNLTGVTIPGSVTSIGVQAFYVCASLASVTIPNGVTNIGDWAFAFCYSLTGVTIPGSVTAIGQNAFYNCTTMNNVTIRNGNGPTSIGGNAFDLCTTLSSVTIGNGVTKIQDGAFEECSSLARVYFTGNAPTADSTVFSDDLSNPTIYYLPGTTGWSSPFASRQALLWNPVIQTGDGSFGVQNNEFGFNITGTPYIPIVVEACTNLVNSTWVPMNTNTLTSGSDDFSDPQWTNYPGRFYRIGSQ